MSRRSSWVHGGGGAAGEAPPLPPLLLKRLSTSGGTLDLGMLLPTLSHLPSLPRLDSDILASPKWRALLAWDEETDSPNSKDSSAMPFGGVAAGPAAHAAAGTGQLAGSQGLQAHALAGPAAGGQASKPAAADGQKAGADGYDSEATIDEAEPMETEQQQQQQQQGRRSSRAQQGLQGRQAARAPGRPAAVGSKRQAGGDTSDTAQPQSPARKTKQQRRGSGAVAAGQGGPTPTVALPLGFVPVQTFQQLLASEGSLRKGASAGAAGVKGKVKPWRALSAAVAAEAATEAADLAMGEGAVDLLSPVDVLHSHMSSGSAGTAGGPGGASGHGNSAAGKGPVVRNETVETLPAAAFLDEQQATPGAAAVAAASPAAQPSLRAIMVAGMQPQQQQQQQQQQQPRLLQQLLPPPRPHPPSKSSKAVPAGQTGVFTSLYRGVTKHRLTGRFEAHFWDSSYKRETTSSKSGRTRGRQVYLGGYETELEAARAYDKAVLAFLGPTATTNFPVEDYEEDMAWMAGKPREEVVSWLRRNSVGFARGASQYRGVTKHHQPGKWESRIGRVDGTNRYIYLGSFDSPEDAARAYDRAAVKFKGSKAITNFPASEYPVILADPDSYDPVASSSAGAGYSNCAGNGTASGSEGAVSYYHGSPGVNMAGAALQAAAPAPRPPRRRRTRAAKAADEAAAAAAAAGAGPGAFGSPLLMMPGGGFGAELASMAAGAPSALGMAALLQQQQQQLLLMQQQQMQAAGLWMHAPGGMMPQQQQLLAMHGAQQFGGVPFASPLAGMLPVPLQSPAFLQMLQPGAQQEQDPSAAEYFTGAAPSEAFAGKPGSLAPIRTRARAKGQDPDQSIGAAGAGSTQAGEPSALEQLLSPLAASLLSPLGLASGGTTRRKASVFGGTAAARKDSFLSSLDSLFGGGGDGRARKDSILSGLGLCNEDLARLLSVAHPGAGDLWSMGSLAAAADGAAQKEPGTSASERTPQGLDGGAGEDFWAALNWLEKLDPSQLAALSTGNTPRAAAAATAANETPNFEANPSVPRRSSRLNK